MLDTIVYIPTILAYAFISLLVIILCFIVVYVSHRIYVCVYDNLPVAHAAISTIMSMDLKDNAPSRSQSGIVLRSASSMNDRKTKTALQIIVTLAPTYLAYVALETDKCSKDSAESHARSRPDSEIQPNKFIKYYDRLSEIPMTSGLSACTSERQLFASPRKLKQKSDVTRHATASNMLTDTCIKSVATSTTCLTLAEETSNFRQEPAEVHASGAMARPAVTFANAVNALANIKIATPEHDQ